MAARMQLAIFIEMKGGVECDAKQGCVFPIWVRIFANGYDPESNFDPQPALFVKSISFYTIRFFYSILLLGAWISAPVVFSQLAETGIVLDEIISPDASPIRDWDLDPHYEKLLLYKGFPIVSSSRVNDAALREAAYLIDRMISHREDIVKALATNKVRLAIMATDEFTTDIPEHATLEPTIYWDKRARGLGASRQRPAVSVGEENLLGYKGDPYATESIMIHEFAHAIHLMGINQIDEGFQKQLEGAFARAKLKGLWKGKYAGTNPSEYWAESVQSWFDTNREDDHDHNHVDTREELIEYDPEIAALVESIFGMGDWRYLKPVSRSEEAHFAGFNPKSAPEFAWPPDLVKAYDELQAGKGLEAAELQPMKGFNKKAVTEESGPSIRLRFENESDGVVSIHWISFDGLRREYNKLDPGRNHTQQTYSGHHWVVVDELGQDLGWVVAPEKDARVKIP